MDTKLILFAVVLFCLNFVSAIIVNADYVTVFPGESERVSLEVDNNGNFDIEDVSLRLDISDLPFSVVGSSERDIDDLDEDDDDSVSFELKASNDIAPGDYQIPYELSYLNVETDEREKSLGSFGIRVSARTELDFSAEAQGETAPVAIVGFDGQVSLEIINKGLGEIKSVVVEINPKGFELLSKDKVFIGSIDSDDTDIASFDVIFTDTNTILSAKIQYKDFENTDKTESVNIPLKVYTKEEAIKKGFISENNLRIYLAIIILVLVVWFIWRKIKKKKIKNNKSKSL